MASLDFSSRYMGRDIWQIRGDGCDCYLVLGGHEALMVDAGQATANIRAFAQTLTHLPVRRVVNTHSHFDHTGGNGRFDEILCTRAAAQSAKNTMGEPWMCYNLGYDFTFVQDGDVIDPGGRPLRVVELDCHSPGSIALLDEREGVLFCGDEVDSGQVLLLPGYAERPGQIHARPAATVEQCKAAMDRLLGLSAQFDALCPAHNGAFIAPEYLEWFSRLCGDVMDGMRGGEDCASPSYTARDTHFPYPNAGYLRAAYKGAGLVYNRHLVRDADLPAADGLPPATPLHLICAYYVPKT